MRPTLRLTEPESTSAGPSAPGMHHIGEVLPWVLAQHALRQVAVPPARPQHEPAIVDRSPHLLAWAG